MRAIDNQIACVDNSAIAAASRGDLSGLDLYQHPHWIFQELCQLLHHRSRGDPRRWWLIRISQI
jgi:hypothetical protein